jgi:MarR-like DNA-binding transcriptional regulator SgrR of sgrS sRNA
MLNTLEGDDLAWFRESIDSGEDATWISRTLATEGIRLSEGIIGHHRRRQCACWDEK